MFVFNTSHHIATAVRGRSVYHFKQPNTTSPKYEDAKDSKTGDAEPKLHSEAGQVIKLKQDHEVYKLKIEHLIEKVDKGFEDVKDGIKRIDRWMMLLIGAFILKGGFDSANSVGVFGKKPKGI